ncbi:MAG: CheR family methyltransferase [Pseudomonadota bacterium]
MTGPKLSEREFLQISRFIHEQWGLKMPPSKRLMLESRLLKRLRKLEMADFESYRAYLFSPAGMENEIIHLIDVVSTNKTGFFREPHSFGYLIQDVLPELVAARGVGLKKPLMVWSAGCSSGEEPYSLAMTLAEFGERFPGLDFTFTILATDVSKSVLDEARLAVYNLAGVDSVPPELRRKYFLISKDRSLKKVRVVPELRVKVKFRLLNLMEDFGMREMMDLIFCRNVIIYFDGATQERLLSRLCAQLIPGGCLFMGHSETLTGMSLPLEPVAPMVYRKKY